jgi:multiple sugar transport system substrate-binding protein
MDKKLWIFAVAAAVAFAAFFIVRAIPPRPVTLVFSQWWSGELPAGALENIARDYEKENAGIKIKIESASRGEVLSRLQEGQAEAKRKKTIDVASIEPEWPGAFSESFAEAYPFIWFIKPLFYNIDLLEKAGFDRPPKNRTEFLSYAQRVSGSGVSGAALALGENRGSDIVPWLLSGGAGISGTLEFLLEAKPYLAADPFVLTEDAKLKLFADGKIAMLTAPVSCVKYFRRIDGLRFGITTVPPPASYIGKPTFDFSCWALAVCAESRHPEEAAAFVKYLLTRAPEIAGGAFAVPGSGSRAGSLAQTDDYYAKAFEMYESSADAEFALIDQFDTGRPELSPSLDELLYDELAALFAGKTTPETAAQAIQEKMQARRGWFGAGLPLK